jgi:hypothetical protein
MIGRLSAQVTPASAVIGRHVTSAAVSFHRQLLMIDGDVVNSTAHGLKRRSRRKGIFSGRVAIEAAMKEKRKIHLLR